MDGRQRAVLLAAELSLEAVILYRLDRSADYGGFHSAMRDGDMLKIDWGIADQVRDGSSHSGCSGSRAG